MLDMLDIPHAEYVGHTTCWICWTLHCCRKQEGMQMTTDVRKALGEKTRLERDKALAKEEAARKALLEVSRALFLCTLSWFKPPFCPGPPDCMIVCSVWAMCCFTCSPHLSLLFVQQARETSSSSTGSPELHLIDKKAV